MVKGTDTYMPAAMAHIFWTGWVVLTRLEKKVWRSRYAAVIWPWFHGWLGARLSLSINQSTSTGGLIFARLLTRVRYCSNNTGFLEEGSAWSAPLFSWRTSLFWKIRRGKIKNEKNYYSIFVKPKIFLTIEEDSKRGSCSVSLEEGFAVWSDFIWLGKWLSWLTSDFWIFEKERLEGKSIW